MMPPDDLIARADAMGIAFDPGEVDRHAAFLGLLAAANQLLNLTRIAEPAEAWERHTLDSLSLLGILAELDVSRAIDIGAGGGIPGIPLAIARPDIEWSLLEATGKKADWLRHAIRVLGISNTEVIQARAEEAGHDRERLRESFDLVTARAVGPLPVLVELTVPFARVGGFILAIKGAQAAAEVEASKEALYRLHTHVVDLHETKTGTIVVMEKQRRTPKIYPRKSGEPKRSPIGIGRDRD